ncbi:hypothetical protein [Lonsdalea populi]|nr:hypothetical protein [Lonsdalea populi]OSM95590.1 hypothetical protein AU508_10880 [Lonsdalea populi]RAT67572.1 hypothetical protein AU504_13960 [Lonsdalea populi]RAT73459.1 hypothetical protein AU505_04890 [Lonsdalea populi]RAT76928.1 hypothetical protein AU506_03765 [Lonsdalea populi]RAT78864.1 hypothetical protein AU507_06535 [Lonsdalea populi]
MLSPQTVSLLLSALLLASWVGVPRCARADDQAPAAAQRDLLAHATETGAAYRRLAAQENALLDYIAGLKR